MPAHAARTTRERVGAVRGAFLSLASLILVGAVGLGTMLGSSALADHLDPSRHFDVFRAFHEPLVVALLIALSVIWILPPHPWFRDSAESAERESMSRGAAA